MKLNRIQIHIFKKLGADNQQTADEYIKEFSIEYLDIQRDTLEDLSEEEGDCWIEKAYFQSLK